MLFVPSRTMDAETLAYSIKRVTTQRVENNMFYSLKNSIDIFAPFCAPS